LGLRSQYISGNSDRSGLGKSEAGKSLRGRPGKGEVDEERSTLRGNAESG
jgi:hypothetical protein